MKGGKVVAIIIGGLAVLLMIFMLLGGEEDAPTSSNKTVSTSKQNTSDSKVVQKTGNDFQSDAEIETVKKLKQSIEVVNEGASKTYVRSCAPCHGRDGYGILAPSIAGKTKADIMKSLQDYKSNLVPNTLMKGLFENISDSELDLLADEISKFEAK